MVVLALSWIVIVFAVLIAHFTGPLYKKDTAIRWAGRFILAAVCVTLTALSIIILSVAVGGV